MIGNFCKDDPGKMAHPRDSVSISDEKGTRGAIDMTPLKALIGHISPMEDIVLHILLTEEDGIIVARCLDFSVSSHGEEEHDALASLSDSIIDYLDYAIQRDAFQEIIDPEEEQFWRMFQDLKLRDEIERTKTSAHFFNLTQPLEVSYA